MFCLQTECTRICKQKVDMYYFSIIDDHIILLQASLLTNRLSQYPISSFPRNADPN